MSKSIAAEARPLLSDSPAMFPIFLKLADRRCLVVGGGKASAPAVEALLSANANVLVVAPKVSSTIHNLANKKKLVWEERVFELSDLDGVCLVICATSTPATDLVIFEESQKRGVMCCVVDNRELSDFYLPAVTRRGALQIAVSTAGYSPALEQRMREELEKQYGPEYEGWLEWLAKARASIFSDPLSPRRRKTLLRKLASQRGLEDFLRRRGVTLAEGEHG
jgi:precorrin-2 dehydrogenase / sirohydrochlorin ferrochelatase